MRTVKLAWLGMGLLLFSAMLGCVSSNGDVVGRSATQRPDWANGVRVEDSGSRFYVFYKKGDIYRLELGIRQAQAAALAEVKNLTLKRIREEFIERADAMKVINPTVLSIIDQAIGGFREDFYPPAGRVENSYHEQIQKASSDGPQITYDVYVLVSLPRDMLGEALIRVAEQIKVSTNGQARMLAEDMVTSLQE